MGNGATSPLSCPGCDKTIPVEVARRGATEMKPLRCKCGLRHEWSWVRDQLAAVELLPAKPVLARPKDEDTIKAAKDYIGSRLDTGVHCPCCGRHSKRYVRPLDSGIARGLVALVRASPKGEIVHVKDIPPLLVGSVAWTSHDFAKARFWGLCEEIKGDALPKSVLASSADKKRRLGFWRSTEKGRQFVFSMIKVPKYVNLVNNKFKGLEGEDISIQDALGEPFDYYTVTGLTRPASVEAGGESDV